MRQRVIAIGDIHGCSLALSKIIGHIEPSSDDTLIVLGDCVDRGPDSCGVIEQLFTLRNRCQLVTLLGNHEEMMLIYLEGRHQPDDWLACGGAETLSSYGPEREIPAEHVEFIRTWQDYWEVGSHFFVHGNYHPELPLAGQRWNLHRWQSLHHHLPAPHCSGKTAVLGHTSQRNGEILDLGYLKCIDTYCYGGGWLTALDTKGGGIWQVDREGRLRSS